MADGSSKPISQVRVGDQVANSVPGDATLQTHTVQKVIVTQTDRDFVDLTVKKLSTALGKAAAGLAASAILSFAAPASADTSTLAATFRHPFYDLTQAAFVDAVDLHPGDRLQTADGAPAEVTSIRAYHQTEVTYDLTINGLHTYYVEAGDTAVLVHNANADPDVACQLPLFVLSDGEGSTPQQIANSSGGPTGGSRVGQAATVRS
ncbi:polymorphic toxin-type HINT domain-containing protein [Kutzneria sp. NPDC052558]|uniref:polymorphic toxin-type HINT domain-containing protein n=1 Tax=Kutzneria sp. NPDC052558 TaxID=3364121 RepID=UPI0037C9C9E6